MISGRGSPLEAAAWGSPSFDMRRRARKAPGIDIIGERTLEIELPAEAGMKSIRVLLGKPEKESEGTWIAPYEIHGPDPGEMFRHVAYGGDALQALGCALYIFPIELESFRQRGRVTHLGDEDLRIGFPIEAGSWDEKSE